MVDFLWGNLLGDLGFLHIDQDFARVYLDHFADLADFQRSGDRGGLPDQNLEVLHVRGVALLADLDGVGTGNNLIEAEVAAGAGGGGTNGASGFIGGSHLGSDHRRACRIRRCTDDRGTSGSLASREIRT